MFGTWPQFHIELNFKSLVHVWAETCLCLQQTANNNKFHLRNNSRSKICFENQWSSSVLFDRVKLDQWYPKVRAKLSNVNILKIQCNLSHVMSCRRWSYERGGDACQKFWIPLLSSGSPPHPQEEHGMISILEHFKGAELECLSIRTTFLRKTGF